jgi:integrase
LQKANLEPIRIHSLRHTYASLLIHSNANITIVAELLGHKNIEETLHTYAHMLPNHQLQTIQKLDDIIKNGIY